MLHKNAGNCNVGNGEQPFQTHIALVIQVICLNGRINNALVDAKIFSKFKNVETTRINL